MSIWARYEHAPSRLHSSSCPDAGRAVQKYDALEGKWRWVYVGSGGRAPARRTLWRGERSVLVTRWVKVYAGPARRGHRMIAGWRAVIDHNQSVYAFDSAKTRRP